MNTYYVTLLLDNVAQYQSRIKAKNIFNAMKQADKEWIKMNWTRGLDDGLIECFGVTGYSIDISLEQKYSKFE